MAYLLVAFLVIILVPFFAPSWRMNLLGLALQGLSLGWIALRTHEHLSASAVIAFIDLVLIRGLIAPRALYRGLSTHNPPRRGDVVPSSLISWALVGALVFVSFRFAAAIQETGLANALHLASATAALLLGMFVLSSQTSMFSQMTGLLRIENAIALFELMSPQHLPVPIQLGVSAVFLLTVFLFGRFLRGEVQHASTAQSADGRPTL
jgi:hydrogenase-4 component E